MADLLSTQLQECSWRGISFPIEMVNERGGQRLAVHHKMDRDGAQVEGTGRLPYSFTVKAYFLDSLTQGVNESWADLFPQTWLQIRNYLERRDSGTFVHPFYGSVMCKPVSWNASFVSDVRNGVIVEMEFIETIDDANSAVNLQPSVISAGESAAADLDQQMIGLNIPEEPDMLGQPSFSDAMSLIVTSGSLAGLGFIDRLTNSLFGLIDTLGAFGDSVASMFDTIYRFIDSLNTLKFQLQAQDKETGVYTVGFDTTLATVANFVGNSIDNIIKLNPALVSYAIVPRETKVTYYLQ